MIPVKKDSEPDTTHGLDLRILPLGDSITVGYRSTDGNGYRLHLLRRLKYLGNSVTYVGSVPLGHFQGDHHEGHSGYTIGEISGQASNSLPSRPNVVLLHAGTNDLNRPVDPPGAPQRLGILIDKILKSCPDAVVLVAQIIPSKTPLIENRIEKFNADIATVISQRAKEGKHVLSVDMFDSFTELDFADSLHPNDRGYRKIAHKWAQAIEEADRIGWIKEPVSIRRC
ncbi:hypothetical protein MMC07_008821 [Pseudocyphellaria aurata]|nr:hypothetical protein [Pseudocyphellaria aurata]